MNDLTLSTPRNELEQALMAETDPQRVQNIVDIFNTNIQKQSVIRAGKFSDLQDKLLTQLERRLEQTPDNLTIQDINSTLKVLSDAQAKQSTVTVDSVPQIQINQQINVGTQELDRESRERVLAAVAQIMKGNNTDGE